MELYIRINSNLFAKACDILAHALGKPILNGAWCANEISVVDHECQTTYWNAQYQMEALWRTALESSMPESRFLLGEKETLSIPNIAEYVKFFHRKYLTGNRMKIFLASNLSMQELKKIAESFNVIPKAALKESFTDSKNATFNEKY
jgi:secreted Zn-dependent insulinase-like peptidase